MPHSTESDSRKLLGRLRDALAEDSAGQARLDRVTALIAEIDDVRGVLDLPVPRR